MFSQTGLCSYYFKKAQHGARLFLAHQMLNGAAVLLAIAGVVVIAVTEEAQGAMASAARHAIYGIALMVAAAVQIMMRMAYPVRIRGDVQLPWCRGEEHRGIHLHPHTRSKADLPFHVVCILFCWSQETPKFRTFHRWFGRLIGLWAYFCAFTGRPLCPYNTIKGVANAGERRQA